jgi:glutathione S-transferase
MAVKLHRCPFTFLHSDVDSCWKVQKALDDQGIEYEVVKHWAYPRSRRKSLIELSGQDLLPVLELDDGTVIRAESADMAAQVREGLPS